MKGSFCLILVLLCCAALVLARPTTKKSRRTGVVKQTSSSRLQLIDVLKALIKKNEEPVQLKRTLQTRAQKKKKKQHKSSLAKRQEDCMVDASSYTGTKATTQGGDTCDPWGDFYPDGWSNYCRNPDNDDKPWCFIPGENWDYCDIPYCTGDAGGTDGSGTGGTGGGGTGGTDGSGTDGGGTGGTDGGGTGGTDGGAGSTIPGCDGTMHTFVTQDVIKVDNYGNNQFCEFTIHALSTQRIQLTFTSLNVENKDATECWDAVDIWDGGDAGAAKLGRYCGYKGTTNLPQISRSSGSLIYVQFNSDDSNDGGNFELAWTFEQAGSSGGTDGGTGGGTDGGTGGGTDGGGTGGGETSACGVPETTSSYIVGGVEAALGSNPWQAILLSHVLCGATIVDKEWLVTAAHCIINVQEDPTKWTVRVGGHTQYDGVEVKVLDIKVHPSYVASGYGYDIALMKTEPMTFDNRVKPACWLTQKVTAGMACQASGWGTTGGGDTSDVLNVVQLPVISDTDCSNAYPQNFVQSLMFCGGYMKGEKDSCQGDSGGPYVCKLSDGAFHLGGVVSWGDGCAAAGAPGVYTRIENFHQWIKTASGNALNPPIL